jgi:hypothetical protein
VIAAGGAARGEGSWLAAAFAIVVVLGLTRLGFPLSGDQALFLVYAQGIADGARLYVDLWDNKQPGVFWFYRAAGGLFGFTPVGVHVLELLWQLAAAALLWTAARTAFGPLPAALVPVLTVGVYYWVAGPWFMTQVEALVALPLAACLLAATKVQHAAGAAARWSLLFGVGAGVVALLKLVLLVVPLAMWAAGAFVGWRAGLGGLAIAVRQACWAAIGFALVAVPAAAHFASAGTWEAFFWTQCVYPVGALAEIPGNASPKQFVVNAGWYVLTFAPAVPLLAYAALRRDREPLRPIEWLALAWLVSGVAAIWVQKFSWWAYHFVLLVPPTGVLIAGALDRATAGRRGWQPQALIVVCAASILLAGGFQAARVGRAMLAALEAPAGQRLDALRDSIDPQHAMRRQATAFIRADPVAGPIYVFGDPNWLLAAARPQALPVHGWAWEFMLQDQWSELPVQLVAAAPSYIYISAHHAQLLASKSPSVIEYLRGEFVLKAVHSDGGAWYKRSLPTSMATPR